MSDLFIILGIVAAFLIGGVAIYNKLQERSYRKRSEEAFRQRHDDVLMGEVGERRIEPKLEVPQPPQEQQHADPDRPWASTLPDAPIYELPGEKIEEEYAPTAPPPEPEEAPRAARGTLYEPRTSIPPGSLREPRTSQPTAKLYEREERSPPLAEKPRGAALLSEQPSSPAGSLREPKTSTPPPTPGETRRPAASTSRETTSVPPGSLRESAKTSVPPSTLRESAKTSVPPGSLRESTKPQVPPESLRGTRPAAPTKSHQPAFAAAANAAEQRSVPPAVAPSPAKRQEFDPPHPSLDYVAKIELNKPLPASAFAQLVAQTRELGKPVRFAGLNALTGSLEALDPSNPTMYKEVTAGLQMADRSGPATDVQIGRFADMLRRAATGLRGRATCPPLHQALASAIELDQFCADVDVTIGLNIVARRNQPFAASRLAQLAEALGFRLAPNGNFEFTDEDGNVIFSLCDQDGAGFSGGRIDGMSTKGVTLLLDVPRVADGLSAFETMITLANDLCEPLGGALVDDNGKPLSERGIENIRAQLRDIYDKMQARQISAGSARARRLFS
jgi:FtsZ-interacting cell division protein ZipA